MMKVRTYCDARGTNPFELWFGRLDGAAASKVTMAVTRIALGHRSNVKGVGAGVLEYRIDFGPGYRIYFSLDGDTLIVLLGGGTKKRQSNDIANAIEAWSDYKQRKRKAT